MIRRSSRFYEKCYEPIIKHTRVSSYSILMFHTYAKRWNFLDDFLLVFNSKYILKFGEWGVRFRKMDEPVLFLGGMGKADFRE